MKKHCPYRQTATGIRISNRKLKWMSPKKDSAPIDLDIILPGSKQFNSLYLNNFNFLTQIEAHSRIDEATEVTDWQEEQDGY